MTTNKRQGSSDLAALERPWGPVLRAARQSLIICLSACVAYSFLTTGSHGGTTAPTDPHLPVLEVNITLRPSPLVFLFVAIVYFSALRNVLTRAGDEAIAVRAFRRASLVAVLVAAASVLIADIWFFASPIGGWPEPDMWLAPFPFGSIDVSTEPVSGM